MLRIRRKLTIEERIARRKKAMQRSKFALPSAITLISVLCGFSSVIISINAINLPDQHSSSIMWAAGLIILAALFDGVDGRVARATKTTSEFGAQLDSIADVVSFGMAPAILAYRYGFLSVGQEDPTARAVGWAASFFFLACGALRLARFNVHGERSDPRFFIGMPIPAGAACIASVIIWWPSPIESARMAYLFSAELFLVGILMVCTLGFPTFKKKSHHPKATLWLSVTFIALLCVLVILPTKFFLGFFAVYVLLALTLNLAWLLGWRGILPPSPLPPRQEDDTGGYGA
jgi:CDP-diacylglycerol--serine O-phosphatidyltransferase